MKFKLKTDGKVKYSKGEQNVFKSLSATPRSSTVLLDKVYPKDAPYNGRKIMIGMLKSLHRKMLENKEQFKVMNTDRNGPHAMSFWLEGK